MSNFFSCLTWRIRSVFCPNVPHTTVNNIILKASKQTKQLPNAAGSMQLLLYVVRCCEVDDDCGLARNKKGKRKKIAPGLSCYCWQKKNYSYWARIHTYIYVHIVLSASKLSHTVPQIAAANERLQPQNADVRVNRKVVTSKLLNFFCCFATN